MNRDHRLAAFTLIALAAYASLLTLPYPLPVPDRVAPWLVNSQGGLQQPFWIFYLPIEHSIIAQTRALFAAVALAFLCSFYLPTLWKRRSTVSITLAGLWWAFGGAVTLQFLALVLAIYLCFHPPAPRQSKTLGVFAIVWLAGGTIGANLYQQSGFDWKVAVWMLAGPLGYALYSGVIYKMLNSPVPARRLRWLVVNFCWVYLGAALLWNANSRGRFPLLVSLLLVFWLWERWVMYLLDHSRARVPEDLSLIDFLAAFLSPAMLVNIGYLNRIGKGYSYMARRYLAREQSLIVRGGLELMAWSLFFLLLRPWMLAGLQLVCQAFTDNVHHDIASVMKVAAGGDLPSAASVWTGLIFDFFNFYLVWTVIGHLKVSFWRLCGYDIEPYFQSPFLATNLVSLWRRYSYYYCEFLIAAFYYPAFLKLRKTPKKLRIFIATTAAATLGNFLWHLLEGLLLSGPTPKVLATLLQTVPFFMLFGLAVGLTSVYLTSVSHRRQPWSGAAAYLARDVVAVAATFGVYIWLRLFRHAPAFGSLETSLQVAGRALGLY